MRAILLIGANFVRSQWIVLTIMLTYVTGIAIVFGIHSQPSEVLFFLQLHTYYAIILSALIAVPAIQNERKSRRILAVLSKGIYRWQYLAGLLSGCAMISALFCLAVGAATLFLARQVAMPMEGLPSFMAPLFFGCMATASVALFCSILLHPLIALGGASIVLLLPLAIEAHGWHVTRALFPVASIARAVLEWSLGSDFRHPIHTHGLGRMAVASLIQAVLFLICSAVAFTRRDITTALE